MKTKLYFLLPLLLLFMGGYRLSGQTMGFILSDEVGLPGDTVAVSIKVEDFTQISGYQGTVRWDSAALDFIDWSSPTAGINNIFGQPGQGLIPLDGATFTWVDFSGGSATLADSSEVMRIRFEIKANAIPATYPVLMNGSVTSLGYSNGVAFIIPNVVQGSVSVSNCISNFDAGFLFPASSCQAGFNPQAIITGDLGGSFSVNGGASIDPITGVLDLNSTTAGSAYQITYTVGMGSSCPAMVSQTIQILSNDDASFSIVDTLCLNANNPTAVVIGLAGGSFSVDNGASINQSTGELDLLSTTAGSSYQITYNTNGPCPSQSTQSIFVKAIDDASFALTDTVCVLGFNPIPSITGQTGGSFTVDQGASIDASTGELFLSSVSTGTSYNITYQTSGDCPNSSVQSIYISGLADASFAYPSSACPNGLNPTANITGLSGGVFSVAPSGNVNPATGELDLSSLSDGTYTITYSLGDACQSFSQQQIIVGDNLAPDSLILPTLMGECSVTAPAVSTTDNCAGTLTGTTNDPLIYNTQGTFTINWTFDDGNGNQIVLPQTVVVQDTTPPSVLCQDFTISLDSTGMAMLLPSQLDNGSSDNCAIASYALSQSLFSAANIGQNAVSLYVTDIAGNVDSCSSIVTVTNTLPPLAVCQDLTVYLDDMGKAAISAIDLDGGSTVNVGTPQLSISQDSFSCADIGPNLISLIVSDSLGAMDTCVAVLSVFDTIAPIVICQDLTLMLDDDSMSIEIVDPTMVDNGSNDACGILSFSLSQDTFGVADIGTQIVTLTATDNNGNTSSCEATVTVKVKNSDSIEDPLAASLRLQVFPNPVEDQLTIDWYSLGYGEISIELLNPLGQILHRETRLKTAENLQTQIEINDLAAGMYIVRVQQAGYYKSLQIIKQ
ncbi:MAG: T9SS type A sorting domain-containing protein [Bacteroidota bacterium]